MTNLQGLPLVRILSRDWGWLNSLSGPRLSLPGLEVLFPLPNPHSDLILLV